MHKIILLILASLFVLTGCSVFKTAPSYKSVDLSKMMPEYYLSYQSGEREDGVIIASGFGEDIDLSTAFEKAIMDAHLTVSNMAGKSDIKFISREYKKVTQNNKQKQQSNYIQDKHQKRYEKIIETKIPSVNIGAYRVLKRDVYKTDETYHAYILTAHPTEKTYQELPDLEVTPIEEALEKSSEN